MANLSQKDLQFCFDELLGELGWGDEVAETGVDTLAWARNEIKDLHKQIKRLRGSLELRNAADNLAETNRYAELFASAPEQADIIRELTDQLMDAAIERHIVMRDNDLRFNTGHRGDYITCPEYRCTKSREALIKGRV
jgi:hypothetical protein